MASLQKETDELKRRLHRMELRAEEKDREQKVRDVKTDAMSSLLYRIYAKAQELDINMELMENTMANGAEMTGEALRETNKQLKEVKTYCGLQSNQENEELQDEEDDDMDYNEGISDVDETLASFSSATKKPSDVIVTMPAEENSLRGMEGK